MNGLGISFYLEEDNYDYIIIIAGYNDLASGKMVDEVINNLLELHKICRNHNVKSMVVNLPLAKEFNKVYKQKCKENNIIHIKLPSNIYQYLDDDHIHFNKKGIKKLISLINRGSLEVEPS